MENKLYIVTGDMCGIVQVFTDLDKAKAFKRSITKFARQYASDPDWVDYIITPVTVNETYKDWKKKWEDDCGFFD